MKTVNVILETGQIEEFRRYLYARENADATVCKYITDIRTFFSYLDGDHTVTKQRVLDYKKWLLEKYRVNSVNSMLAALNQFWEFLELDGLKVRRVKIQKNLFLSEDSELTQKEHLRLLRSARAEGKEQLALCMETIVCTGIRISELVFFTVEAVKKNHIEIRNKGKCRRIFIPGKLRMKLLNYAKKNGIRSGAVFVTKNGKPKSRSTVWKEMKALKEKAGVDGQKIFPHNLRHLFARLYYEVTKDLAGLADLLGHSSLNVTRIYTSSTGKIYQKRLDMISYRKGFRDT